MTSRPLSHSPFERFKAPDAAIYANYKGKSVSLCLLKCRNVYAVSFGKSVGDVKACLDAEPAQDLSQKDGPGRSIDVIIAPDHYLFAAGGGLQQARDGFAHAF